MSEYVSYNTTAMIGGVGNSLLQALKKVGIFLSDIHDVGAWKTARSRAEELQRIYQNEFETCRAPLSGVEGEIAKTEAMLEAFCSVREFRVFTEKRKGDELRSLRKEIDSMKNTIYSGKSSEALRESAVNAQDRLEKLATSVQEELCGLEKDVVIETSLQPSQRLALNAPGHRYQAKELVDKWLKMAGVPPKKAWTLGKEEHLKWTFPLRKRTS